MNICFLIHKYVQITSTGSKMFIYKFKMDLWTLICRQTMDLVEDTGITWLSVTWHLSFQSFSNFQFQPHFKFSPHAFRIQSMLSHLAKHLLTFLFCFSFISVYLGFACICICYIVIFFANQNICKQNKAMLYLSIHPFWLSPTIWSIIRWKCKILLYLKFWALENNLEHPVRNRLVPSH